MATPANPVVGSNGAAPGAAAPGGQPGGAEQSVPYARFKEVNDQLKAFKDLNFTPEELNEALVALAAFVEQANAAAQAQPSAGSNGTQPNNGQGNGQWTQKQWEEWLFQQYPWLRSMKEGYDRQQESTQSRNDWRVTQAQERLKGLAVKAGYSEEKLKQLEDIVAALIKSDPNMMAAWENGDLSVVEQAFKAHQTGFVEPVARNYATSVSGRKATNRAELAPRVTGGNAPPPQQPEKPKTVADAHQAAMDKLAEAGSDLPEGEEIVEE